MDGRAYTNKELAFAAEISAQTASDHLSRLRDAGLVTAEKSGRCVYHAIASQDVADMLEAVAAFAPLDRLSRGRLCRGQDRAQFVARRCYRHLGGRLAVLLAEKLIASGDVVMRNGLVELCPQSGGPLDRIGFVAGSGSGPMMRTCLDWTERRQHFGGRFGVDFMTHLQTTGWIEDRPGSRIVTVTASGLAGLRDVFGLVADHLNDREGRK